MILTITMIVGVITVVGLLVTRMPDASAFAPLSLPERLDLPEGTEAKAVTAGNGWFAVVTEDDRILIFNGDGSLREDIAISPAQ